MNMLYTDGADINFTAIPNIPNGYDNAIVIRSSYKFYLFCFNGGFEISYNASELKPLITFEESSHLVFFMYKSTGSWDSRLCYE